MVYDKKDIYSQLTDKVEMRKYVTDADFGNYLPILYYVGNEAIKIPFDDLPSSFIVKPNHASGHVIFVDSQHPRHKQEIINTCREWLNFSRYERGRESPYKAIEAKIIVEQHLGDNATLPVYKFYCFRGKSNYILVGKSYFTKNKKNAAYNAKWEKIEIAAPSDRQEDFPKPPQLKEMLQLASELSNSFDFLRVDLYNVSGKIFISELTVTPAAGSDKFLGKQNKILGQQWKIKAS